MTKALLAFLNLSYSWIQCLWSLQVAKITTLTRVGKGKGRFSDAKKVQES